MKKFDVAQLTPAQETVYKVVLNAPKGIFSKDVAAKLNLDASGVSKHLSAIYQLGGLTREVKDKNLLYSIASTDASTDTPKTDKVETPAPKKAAAKPEKVAKVKPEPKEKAVKASVTKDVKPVKAAKTEAVQVETEPVIDNRKQAKTSLRGKKPLIDKSKILPEAKYLKADGSIKMDKVSPLQRGAIVEVTNRFTKEKEKAVVIGHYWEFWQGKWYTDLYYVSDSKVHFALTSTLVESKGKVAVKEILEAHPERKIAEWKTALFVKAFSK